MNIQFKGITHYTGSPDTLEGRMKDDFSRKDFVNAIALRYRRRNDEAVAEGVVLTGKDMVSFMKDNFNLTIPDELMACQSQDELIQLMFSDNEAIKPIIGEILDFAMNSDPALVDEKVFEYYTTKKQAGGQDIEGKPILEVTA